MKVSVIGLGKLGLPMATYLASKGHDVVGLDVGEDYVGRLRKGECPISETGLAELLSQQAIQFTTNFVDTLDTEIAFIIVPTPSLPNGRFNNEYVETALACLSDYRGLITVTSTVMPGSCRKFKAILPNTKICYNPEFIALGSVLRDMEYPDAILIGEEDVVSGDLLSHFHETLHGECPPICRMSWENAEVAKLALNVSVTMKVGIANMLTEVCENIAGGDVDAVTGFIGLDTRIGSKYLKGGPSFGGPCFPRDGRAFAEMAKDLLVNSTTVEANDRFNKEHNINIAKRVLQLSGNPRKCTVAVLGLTYKPNSCIVEESSSVEVVKALLRVGFKVKVFDPQGMLNMFASTGNKVEYCKDVSSCLYGSDLAVVATPWNEIKSIDADLILRTMRTPVILDCWRTLSREALEGVEYHALGVNL